MIDSVCSAEQKEIDLVEPLLHEAAHVGGRAGRNVFFGARASVLEGRILRANSGVERWSSAHCRLVHLSCAASAAHVHRVQFSGATPSPSVCVVTRVCSILSTLGILIDAVPESLVIGVLVSNHSGSPAAVLPFVLGVFFSNLPESMSASGTLKAA